MVDLDDLLRRAVAKFDAMTPAEQDAMLRQQIEGVARAEASWPKSNYHWENGVKVYHSMEDYWND